MSYIGVQPSVGQYRKLDDISGSFDGVVTTFTTSVGGINVTAGSPQQLLVSVGGVIQQPVTDYSTSTNSITFSTAPAGGLDFFAVLMGDAVNVGIPSDGSVTSAKLNSDLTVDLDSGTAAAPSLTFDSDTGLFSPGADEVAISTGGTQRTTVDSSGRLLVGTSSTSATGTLSLQGNSASSSGAAHFRMNLGGSPGTTDGLGYIIFGDSSDNPAAYIQADRDGGTWTSGSSHPGRLVFSVTRDGSPSPTEALRITNQGVAQITAVDTNSASLVVSANATSGSQYGVLVASANDQNATGTYFFRGVGGSTERFTVRTDGGIANYSANNVNLSDRNAKKDITPATGTWDCIKEWEIVNYRYKNQPDDVDLNLGVIAQQVAESCPEVITVFQEAKEATEDQPAQEERLGVKEQQMYWMAIKALQEAQIRIEALEAEVAALKA